MDHTGPQFTDVVKTIFSAAPFMNYVGIEATNIAPGLVESRLVLQPHHMQQNGFAHAGVQATMADHSAGAAAATLMGLDETVLTAEFKINLLRPAKGEALYCRAQVLKPGRMITVVESEVFVVTGEAQKLCAKATVTLAVMKLDGNG